MGIRIGLRFSLLSAIALLIFAACSSGPGSSHNGSGDGQGDASGGDDGVGGSTSGGAGGEPGAGGTETGGAGNGGSSSGGSSTGGGSTGGAGTGGSVDPGDPPTYIKLESAARQSCALRLGGKLECWGAGGATRPPEGTYSDFALSSSGGPFDGLEFGCAVRADDGGVECWGSGITPPLTPPDTKFTELSAASDESVCGVRKDDGRIECWGRFVKQEAPNVEFSSVENAGDVCGVRTADLMVSCFNQYSDLIVDYADLPLGRYRPGTMTQVGSTAYCAAPEGSDELECFAFSKDSAGTALTPDALMPASGGYSLLAGTRSHACGALAATGENECWGEARWSWSAGGKDYVAHDPGFLTPSEADLSQLSSTLNGVCGIVKASSLVECSGGQRSLPDNGLQFASVVSDNVTCGLLIESGEVACVADYLGQGESRFLDAPSDSFDQLVLGEGFACGLREAGQVKCWGPGHLGPVPTTSFSRIAAGPLTICGIRTDDSTLECWNADGTSPVTPPEGEFLEVKASAEVDQPRGGHVDVYSGDVLEEKGAQTSGNPRMCGIKGDNALACWGCEGAEDCEVPTGTFDALDVSFGQACAVSTSGVTTCFPGTAAQPKVGVAFSKIGVGVDYACGLDDTDGTVSCWGSGTTRTPPEDAFSDISVGQGYACGVRETDGKLVCWGELERNIWR